MAVAAFQTWAIGATAPSTPAAGYSSMYFDVNGTFNYIDAAGIVYALYPLASQAVMETGTSLVTLVTPGRQANHPGHPKFWAMVTVSAGTPTLQTSYNVTSITDTGTGLLTVTIATDFSSANWKCGVTVERAATALTVANLRYAAIRNAGLAAGTVLAECWDGTAVTANQVDPTSWHLDGSGDQA